MVQPLGLFIPLSHVSKSQIKHLNSKEQERFCDIRH